VTEEATTCHEAHSTQGTGDEAGNSKLRIWRVTCDFRNWTYKFRPLWVFCTFSRKLPPALWLRLLAVYCLLLAASLLPSCGPGRQQTVVIGSKNFTGQAILGEMLAQHLEARTGLHVERRFYLAGTYICHQAILAARIDAYVEYTGTALTAILKQPVESDPRNVFDKVKREYASRFGLEVMAPLGFNNTFAIVIRGADARRLNLHTLSEAVPYAVQWRPGFGYEFMERPDGYQGLVRTYHLRFGEPPRIMDLGLLYRALLDNQVDLVAGNSTDGQIAARDFTVLRDDRHYFPPYQAVPVVRRETLQRHPLVRKALDDLAGRISDDEMRQLNYAVEAEHKDGAEVVREFLRAKHLD
jgi:osmoprotectant transport system substrate-binding protein